MPASSILIPEACLTPSELGLNPDSGWAVFEATDENSEDGIDLYDLIVNEKQQYFGQILSVKLIY